MSEGTMVVTAPPVSSAELLPVLVAITQAALPLSRLVRHKRRCFMKF